MSQRARRILITAAVLMLVAGIAGIMLFGGGQQRAQKAANDPAPATGLNPANEVSKAPADAASGAANGAANGTAAAAPGAQATPPSAAAPATPLTARAPAAAITQGLTLGSLDPKAARFQLAVSPRGVGLDRITFSEYWHTAAEARQAAAHHAAVIGAAGSAAPANAPALPPESARYSLHPAGKLGGAAGVEVPLLAVRVLDVDGQQINLLDTVWSQTAPGEFTTTLVDAQGKEHLRVVRRIVLRPEQFDVVLEQRVQNTGSVPHTVTWIQAGPPDLSREPQEMVDTRRFQSGYLMSPERDPAQSTVIVHGAMVDHATVLKQLDQNNQVIWPTQREIDEKYGLSWFGSTNRYFALAVHAPYAPPTSTSKLIGPAVVSVKAQQGQGLIPAATPSAAPTEEHVVETFTVSAPAVVQPGATASFDMGFFAGPLDRTLLTSVEPFAALNMQGLILYLMSGCCSWCTFSWLADFLVWFLGMLHNYVVFDWSLAIIVLVIVVRLCLHPLTRRGQISVQRVTRQMQAIKPEMEALQKRYKDDPKRLQQETWSLYRERGVNPLGCAGGMLPTFLQMPIWVALYATLYFAFELRQQPAFFGVFQQFGGWGFLGDLSAPDRLIPLPMHINLFILQLSSINLIPLLMGFVFFVQQKYMTPPPATQLTPEQESQQKMMKWMTVILFPLMLYNAPSGLTLYIATSTAVGIFEGMRVRKEVEKMDFSKQKKKQPGFLARMMQAAQERAAAAAQDGQQGKRPPSRKFRDK